MVLEAKQAWIYIGYDLFSKEGPKGIKVEVLAKKVGKSKSSFYHHFSDLEFFMESLLNLHLEKAKRISLQAAKCKKMAPDLLNLLIDIKQDLLFNRQLRINRQMPNFKQCFQAANKLVENAFLDVWAIELGLSEKKHLAQSVLSLTVENFYLQITEETLTYNWLKLFLIEIQAMVRGIRLNN